MPWSQVYGAWGVQGICLRIVPQCYCNISRFENTRHPWLRAPQILIRRESLVNPNQELADLLLHIHCHAAEQTLGSTPCTPWYGKQCQSTCPRSCALPWLLSFQHTPKLRDISKVKCHWNKNRLLTTHCSSASLCNHSIHHSRKRPITGPQNSSTFWPAGISASGSSLAPFLAALDLTSPSLLLRLLAMTSCSQSS